ncbi:MAG: hypothetical protein ACJ8HI_07220 [Massilia sp.]|jgi:hypothetical protein
MKKIILFAALLVSAAPVAAATSSADLDAIAKVLEQSGPSATLNTQLLSLLREPAKTLDGVTLPSTAAQYTTTIDTALKLRPKGWIAGGSEQYPAAASGVNCTAHLSLWVPDSVTSPTGERMAGMRMEAFSWGKGNCAAVTSAAIARAWAWKLKQVGR